MAGGHTLCDTDDYSSLPLYTRRINKQYLSIACGHTLCDTDDNPSLL
ncbi:hypothetical protein [Myroides odoratimimus]